LKTRLERCREAMAQRDISALLVTNIDNVRYLSGFSGSAGSCLITRSGAHFVTDGRYGIQARLEVKDFVVHIDTAQPQIELNSLLKSVGTPIGYEADSLTVARLQHLQDATGRQFEAASGLVEELRLLKDADEIATIRQAVRIVDETFAQVIGFIRAGRTEKEIALEIDMAMRRRGAEKAGFDTIVASGPHSAWPHAHPTDRILERGDFVTLDFGALYNGYNSDITRTVVVGAPSDRQRQVYAVVLEAQLKALDAIRPGLKGKDVDAAARDIIERAGYGNQFMHSLGHSLGRTVHDGPGFGRTVEQELAPGMVLTVEPGIYVEGWGGIRIEDDVMVTADGCEILTRSAKTLLSV